MYVNEQQSGGCYSVTKEAFTRERSGQRLTVLVNRRETAE